MLLGVFICYRYGELSGIFKTYGIVSLPAEYDAHFGGSFFSAALELKTFFDGHSSQAG
jgi:hypothetical protein